MNNCKLLWLTGAYPSYNLYNFIVIGYDEIKQTANTTDEISCPSISTTKENIIHGVNNREMILCNASVMPDGTIQQKHMDYYKIIESTASAVREYCEINYGTDTDLCGHCIEASELIKAILNMFGIDSKVVEGWCRWDYDWYGSDRPYDPHTWVEVGDKINMIYIDVTADQFNPGMENEYPNILIHEGLPRGMFYIEPSIA